jgi:4-hydroxy-4-methyl-2-oxoglutarate aldolase
MLNVIVTGVQRASSELADKLAEYGVATVHEAIGRDGYLGTGIRPIQDGARIGGTAVTAVCWPGDNLMIHAAVEQCQPGDVLVVTTTSPCPDGAFGELIATSLKAHGVRGLITTTGVRDVTDLRAMPFPVWSAAVSAQGTVKATPGAVNVPVVIGGQIIHPGDVIVADDDGVVCVPRSLADWAISQSAVRLDKEAVSRSKLAAGELALDFNNLRPLLAGVEYITAEEYARRAGA